MAETVDGTIYMPSISAWASGTSWTYSSDSYLCLGVQPFAGQAQARAIYSSRDNAYTYWLINNDGLYLLGAYYFNVPTTSGGQATTSLTTTYLGTNNSPGLLVIPASVTTGTTLLQSGTVSYSWGNGSKATLSYNDSVTFTGFESKTVPFRGKDTTYNALKRQETILISGFIGNTYTNTLADSTLYYAKNIGKIAADTITTVNGITSSFSEYLTETNLVPLSSDATSGTTTTNVIDLALGWNLLGNGTDQSITVNTSTFPTEQFATVWKWNAADNQWAFFNPSMSAEELSQYAGNKGYAVLSAIGKGQGFWAHAITNTTIPTPSGTSVSALWLAEQFNSGDLPGGWNLLGIGQNLTPNEFNAALSLTPPGPGTIPDTGTGIPPNNFISLWVWDNINNKWRFYSPAMEADQTLDQYILDKGYEDFTITTIDSTTGAETTNTMKLRNGIGFWLNR